MSRFSEGWPPSKVKMKSVLIKDTSYDDERYVERTYLCTECGDDGCCELRSITRKGLGSCGCEKPFACPWPANLEGDTLWIRTDEHDPEYYLAVGDTIISSAYVERSHAEQAIKELCLMNVTIIER